MSESKPSLATEHLKNDQRALHPMVLPVAPPRLTSDDALANGQLDHLVQKSTHTPETLSVKAAVPIQQDDSSFQSRFVEDLPDSVHSKPVSESQVNTTWHVHEPIVAEGAIPAAIAAKAQALATLQVSCNRTMHGYFPV